MLGVPSQWMQDSFTGPQSDVDFRLCTMYLLLVYWQPTPPLICTNPLVCHSRQIHKGLWRVDWTCCLPEYTGYSWLSVTADLYIKPRTFYTTKRHLDKTVYSKAPLQVAVCHASSCVPCQWLWLAVCLVNGCGWLCTLPMAVTGCVMFPHWQLATLPECHAHWSPYHTSVLK